MRCLTISENMKLSVIRKHRELSLYVLDVITIVTAYFLAYGMNAIYVITMHQHGRREKNT